MKRMNSNFWLSSTIVPLLIVTLNSDTFERSHSDLLMAGMMAIGNQLGLQRSFWYRNATDCSTVVVSHSAVLPCMLRIAILTKYCN